MCDTWNAIHLIHTRLKEAMPVHKCSFVLKFVCDFDPDHISVVCFDQWSWELSIDTTDGLLGLDAIRSDIALSNGEVVRSSSSRQMA